MDPQRRQNKRVWRRSVSVASAAGIGMIFGAALGNPGVGLVLGAAAGVAIGSVKRG